MTNIATSNSINVSVNVDPLGVVTPLANGIITLAMVSAMASIMAMATSTTVTAAGISTMGSFIPYSSGSRRKKQTTASSGEKKQPARITFSNPYEELESLNETINKLSYKIDSQKKSVQGTREHERKLMIEYGLGIMPSVVELKKYPKLRATHYQLVTAEKDLDRMELSLMFKQRRRKELQMKLGIRAEESEARKVYPATKKKSWGI